MDRNQSIISINTEAITLNDEKNKAIAKELTQGVTLTVAAIFHAKKLGKKTISISFNYVEHETPIVLILETEVVGDPIIAQLIKGLPKYLHLNARKEIEIIFKNTDTTDLTEITLQSGNLTVDHIILEDLKNKKSFDAVLQENTHGFSLDPLKYNQQYRIIGRFKATTLGDTLLTTYLNYKEEKDSFTLKSADLSHLNEAKTYIYDVPIEGKIEKIASTEKNPFNQQVLFSFTNHSDFFTATHIQIKTIYSPDIIFTEEECTDKNLLNPHESIKIKGTLNYLSKAQQIFKVILFYEEGNPVTLRINPIKEENLTLLLTTQEGFIKINAPNYPDVAMQKLAFQFIKNTPSITVNEKAHQYIVIGTQDNNKGYGYISDDGVTWRYLNQLTNDDGFNKILWNDDLAHYIVLGNKGSLLISNDGYNWQSHPLPIWSNINALSWNASEKNYIVVGDYGYILKSQDGIHWTATNTYTSAYHLIGITSGPDCHIALFSQSHGIMISTNQQPWQYQPWSFQPKVPTLRAITYSHFLDQFLIVGDQSTLLLSPDKGKTWDLIPISEKIEDNKYMNLIDVKWLNTLATYVALGTEGTILTSDNGYHWEQINFLQRFTYTSYCHLILSET